MTDNKTIRYSLLTNFENIYIQKNTKKGM